MFGLFKKKVYYDPLKTEGIYYNELPSSVKTQLSVLKSLDLYTQKHIEDVPRQVYKICRQLGLPEERVRFMMIAAYLHDVGKMFVPPEILQKPGKLTDEEYEIMKSHSVKGYEICMSFQELVPYATTVRGHHEALDGSGYPDGLVDKQISYETRILTVADIYSALKSKRQYKEAWTTKQVFEIMYDDVKQGKMDGEILFALLQAVINESKYELKQIKIHLEGYMEQLEYNEIILNYLDKYITAKMNPIDILSDMAMNSYMKKLVDYEIVKGKDVADLLSHINSNIMTLTKQIHRKDEVEQDIKELTEYQKKIIKEVGIE